MMAGRVLKPCQLHGTNARKTLRTRHSGLAFDPFTVDSEAGLRSRGEKSLTVLNRSVAPFPFSTTARVITRMSGRSSSAVLVKAGLDRRGIWEPV